MVVYNSEHSFRIDVQPFSSPSCLFGILPHTGLCSLDMMNTIFSHYFFVRCYVCVLLL